MKTPEDEAFEDIERRQGGGFPAKRAMAADRFKDGIEWWMDTTTYGAYPNPPQWHIDTGKLVRLVPAQPAQEPVARVLQIIKELRPAIKPMEGMGKGKTTAEWFDILVKEIERIQPAQEPVAWMVYTLDGKSVCVTDNPTDFTDEHRALPLYTTPPKRTWVGLTDEERDSIAQDYRLTGFGYQSPFKAIEDKLKEKNI